MGVRGGTAEMKTIFEVIDAYLEANPKELYAKIKRKDNGIYYFDIFIPQEDFAKVKKYIPNK